MNQQLQPMRTAQRPPLRNVRSVVLAEPDVPVVQTGSVPETLSDWAPALVACENPAAGYRWIYIQNRFDAEEAFLAAAAAHRHGLEKQVRIHLKTFLEEFHEDLVFGHVVPVIKCEMNFPEAGVLKNDFRPSDSVEQYTFNSGDYRLLVERIEVYGRAIPLSALTALDKAKSLDIPFANFWVVTPTWVRNDPILAGRISHYLVGAAYWL